MSRTMEHAAVGLERLVTGSVRRAPAELAPMMAWPLSCGQAVASRTRAIQFENGILQVQVADAGWKRELQALAPQYLAILNRYVRDQVKRIEFTIRPKTREQATRVGPTL